MSDESKFLLEANITQDELDKAKAELAKFELYHPFYGYELRMAISEFLIHDLLDCAKIFKNSNANQYRLAKLVNRITKIRLSQMINKIEDANTLDSLEKIIAQCV